MRSSRLLSCATADKAKKLTQCNLQEQICGYQPAGEHVNCLCKDILTEETFTKRNLPAAVAGTTWIYPKGDSVVANLQLTTASIRVSIKGMKITCAMRSITSLWRHKLSSRPDNPGGAGTRHFSSAWNSRLNATQRFFPRSRLRPPSFHFARRMHGPSLTSARPPTFAAAYNVCWGQWENAPRS